MGQLEKLEERINLLDAARTNHGSYPQDQNRGIGLKCIAFSILGIAHSIKYLADMLYQMKKECDEEKKR